jgi:phosphate transport system substrate-binding protein
MTTAARLLAAVLVALVLLGAGSCRRGGGTTAGSKGAIKDIGSDTMLNLAGAWAEAYRKVRPDVSVQVTGGGSGVGFTNLREGTADIANASREIEPSEIEKVKAKTGKEPREFAVGMDALAIYVNRDNPLDTISEEELAEIYGENGTITKWSQLGVTVPGDDKIILVSRQNSSGTWKVFQEIVLGKDRNYRQGAMELSGSKDIVTLVGRTPAAIGYSGMGYKDPSVKFLKVSKKKGEPGVAPSVESVLSHTYPIARKLYFYTVGEPTGDLKAYIDWILSPAGQAVVEKGGYVPIRGEGTAAEKK